MLMSKAIEEAVPLTQQLDAANRKLTPLGSTPLESLCQATARPMGGQIGGAGDEYVPNVYGIEMLTNSKDPILGECKHDTVMDEVTRYVTQAIQNQINRSRTIVQPAVEDLVSRINSKMSTMPASDVLQTEIVVEEVSGLLQSEPFLALVHKFSDKGVHDVAFGLNLPPQDIGQLRGYLKTNIPSVDSLVDDWIGTKGEQFLADVWRSVFSFEPNVRPPLESDSFYHLLTNRVNGQDVALVVFLIANRLYQDGPMDGVDASLDHFKDFLSQYRDQAAGVIERGAEQLSRDITTGSMVRSYEGFKAYVNGPVYRKFLNEGGTADIVLGALVSGSVDRSATGLLKDAEEYNHKWDNFIKYQTATENNMRFATLKKVVVNSFEASLLDDVEINSGADAMEAAGKRERLVKQFKDAVDLTRESDYKNMYRTVLRLLCETRFAMSGCDKLLNMMDDMLTENPGMEPREAATVASVRLIIQYCIQQFKIEDA